MQIENALQGRIQLNHFKHGRGDGESSPLPVKSGSIQSKISIVNEKAQGNFIFLTHSILFWFYLFSGEFFIIDDIEWHFILESADM